MTSHLTPEFGRATTCRPPILRPSRRLLCLGAGGMALTARGALAQKFKPRDNATEDADQLSDTFTGDLYGHTVTWDPEWWRLSSSSQPGESIDQVTLSDLELGAGFHVEHGEVPFGSIAEAEDGALDHYLAIYAMTMTDIVHLESWSSRDAVGELYYWTGYDDDPYTYIEYAPTDDVDIWSILYYQVRASAFDDQAIADMLDGVWLDDESPIRAADIEDIIETIADDL